MLPLKMIGQLLGISDLNADVINSNTTIASQKPTIFINHLNSGNAIDQGNVALNLRNRTLNWHKKKHEQIRSNLHQIPFPFVQVNLQLWIQMNSLLKNTPNRYFMDSLKKK